MSPLSYRVLINWELLQGEQKVVITCCVGSMKQGLPTSSEVLDASV